MVVENKPENDLMSTLPVLKAENEIGLDSVRQIANKQSKKMVKHE